MLIYAKLLTGDLIQLVVPQYASASDVMKSLHHIDPQKYPIDYIRILRDENETLKENDIVPVFVDMEPLFKQHKVHVYEDQKNGTVSEFSLQIEFDLQQSIDLISFNAQDPRGDPFHFEKTELTDNEWDICFEHLKKVRKCILTIREKNNENYEVTVRPYSFSNLAYNEGKRTFNDIRELSTIKLGISFEYEVVKILGKNELVYQLLSFRFKESVAGGIIKLFEKVKTDVFERPYMYSIYIYTRLLNENKDNDICVDYSLYTEVLYQIDPRTVLDIEMDYHEEDYDNEGPRHVEKCWAILIKEIDGTYKIKWHNSFLSRRSYEADGSEKVLSTHGFDPEIHTATFLNKEIKKAYKPFRKYLLESDDLKPIYYKL
jgi:hypothetical protein